MHSNDVWLTVVAVSRNDNHGGDMTRRMQFFVDGFIAQCRRHRIDAELILVEWNPPADRPPLEKAMVWPVDFGPAKVRIVTVPPEIHARFDHAPALPLFQMIGKNVGIRRARGRFVLATNVDILFNDALAIHMRDHLRPGTMLRVDRHDVPRDILSGVPFDAVLADCRKRFFQVNTRFGIFDASKVQLNGVSATAVMSTMQVLRLLATPYAPWHGWRNAVVGYGIAAVSMMRSAVQEFLETVLLYLTKIVPLRRLPIRLYYLGRRITMFFDRVTRRAAARLQYLFQTTGRTRRESSSMARLRRSQSLHTLACGDFTLLSRDDWFRLRGYAEWPIFSWHLDSLLLYAANAIGIRQVTLNSNYHTYHIDHSSGWTLASNDALFSRLRAKGIPFLTNEDLQRHQRAVADDPRLAVVNDSNWGLCAYDLPERHVGPGGRIEFATATRPAVHEGAPCAAAAE